MAEDFKVQSPGDRNRDGMNDDVDRRLGNSNDSASYARRYDPRSEQEYTNLPEPQEVIQARILADKRAQYHLDAQEAMRAAQKDVHFFPDVGKFIIPAENTWAAHAELVQNNDMRLHFNPDKYFFDKIIADKLNTPALVDKKHPDFEKYKGLRTNLEVLRNDIIGMYLDDGGFDKGDEKFIAPMQGIAETLAEALANDVWWKRPFVNYFSKDVANVEAVGAAEMYKFLLRTQDKTQVLAGFTSGLRQMLGTANTNWGLLPLERSPFSPEALSAPPPNFNQPSSQAPAPIEVEKNIAEKRAMESLALINETNSQFKQVDAISVSDKEMSVEDGRTILRWLRNLQGVDKDVQDFLSAGTPPEQIAKAEALSGLVRMYAGQMQRSAHLHRDAVVKDGSDAAGGAAMMIAEHAMTLLPEGSPARALLASAIDSMPESHYERSTQSVERLLDHMELGLAKMSGQKLGERTAIDRLVAASERIHTHAKQLRSVDTLTEPKREESVELGREILRKLRGMMFSDKPIEEQMDTGKPEEKAALIEKIEEMVEIYRNILADALAVNPGLADDPRIKEASDAVGGMTHGIKLMASKDIPANQAQAQQISADVTQMPEQWKDLSGRAVNRLLDTMEGALAAAVDSIDAADQAAEKDAELAQEAIEASLQQANSSNSKRRKRRSQKSSTLTGKKQQKLNRDLTADDMAAGQGRFANQGDKKDEKNALNLNSNDLATIKSLGSALRGAGQKAKSLPMADVKIGDDIKGDNKSAAERAIEQITSSRRNPNNRRST